MSVYIRFMAWRSTLSIQPLTTSAERISDIWVVRIRSGSLLHHLNVRFSLSHPLRLLLEWRKEKSFQVGAESSALGPSLFWSRTERRTDWVLLLLSFIVLYFFKDGRKKTQVILAMTSIHHACDVVYEFIKAFISFDSLLCQFFFVLHFNVESWTIFLFIEVFISRQNLHDFFFFFPFSI